MSDKIPLATQVGGHLGIHSTADGSLIIKPCLAGEKDFYTLLTSSEHFAHLRPFVPRFLGVLRLEGSVELNDRGEVKSGEVAQIVDEGEKESIVLENLAFPFKRPNIIDIKLGTVLWDPSATPEKRERMEKTARETTSLETGIRLTGFQVWDPTAQTTVMIPKSYGKSIAASELPAGVKRFIPTGSVPPRLLERMIECITHDVRKIRDAVQATEMRMIGGSLLIIWEGDSETLEKAFEAWDARTAKRNDEDEGEEEDEDEDEDEESEDDTGTGDITPGGTTINKPKKLGPPFLVKLIDFAHTRHALGEGPDQGVLLGLKTTLDLLDGRLKEIREAAV
ncbi:hypothetical protein BOTBODRAFT_103744 [Botryobasidium botryosum FD-172 SS1]|uniref:Kinase n=1 Tax=Botryobasidium botryosum (strain FD-172 SS1) TaxID=930990 RepID=A0A067N459_BOTB1|nr:hypothetical protein BOTBODRAFT_103744 [Botryobasidium botryosum FD-172 SS1]